MPAQQCLRRRNKAFATEHTSTRQFVKTRVTSCTNTMVVQLLGTAIVQCSAVQCSAVQCAVLYESYLFHFLIRARASPSNPKLQAHPTCCSHRCSPRRCRHPESSTLPTKGDVAKHACNHLCTKAYFFKSTRFEVSVFRRQAWPCQRTPNQLGTLRDDPDCNHITVGLLCPRTFLKTTTVFLK